jgi:hypothetical protein
MSSTIITNHPAPGASVTVLYPGEAGTDPARVTLSATLGGAQLNGREARMVASRLIRAAGKIGRRYTMTASRHIHRRHRPRSGAALASPRGTRTAPEGSRAGRMPAE